MDGRCWFELFNITKLKTRGQRCSSRFEGNRNPRPFSTIQHCGTSYATELYVKVCNDPSISNKSIYATEYKYHRTTVVTDKHLKI